MWSPGLEHTHPSACRKSGHRGPTTMKTAPMVRLRLALSAVAVIVVLASAPQPSAAATWWTPLPLLPDVPFASTANALFGWLLNNRPTPRLAWRAASGLAPTHVKHMAFDSIFHQGTHEYRNLSAHYSIGYDERQMHTAGERGLPPMRTVKARTWKPRNTAPYLQAHRVGDDAAVISESQAMDWDEIEVDAPDVSDRKTLLALAKMASKAYEAPPGEGGQTWSFGGSQKWNLSESFGWVADGIRGHIFRSTDNSTIVVALKGTSAALLDDGSTSKRDKENDNLLFSCCCARVGWTWHTVCDCYDDHGKDGQTCSSSCLTKALIKRSFFYPATTDLFNNISYAYPNAQIWITGHSLGGALGSLIGMTFGYPTVTFEAPAERMAALRLHLPLPVKHTNMDALPITHVYHTGDPIPMGECIGATSLCANFGFALESRCHSGKTVLYDTVGKLGWSSSVVSHRISTLVEDLLTEDWDKKVGKAKLKLKQLRSSRGSAGSETDKDKDKDEKLSAVPALRSEKDCVDCLDWKFTND